MSPVKFLVLVAATPVILCAAYIAGFIYQIGAPYAAEYGMADSLVVKREVLARAAQSPGPKLMIVGGSSAFFGLDSKILQTILGIPTFNLALAAHLPIEYYTDMIKPSLRSGDLVLLAFEYEYYKNPTPYYPDFTDQVLTWLTEYFHNLSIGEQIKLMASVPWYRVVGGVLTTVWKDQIEGGERRKILPPDSVRRRIKAIWNGEIKTVEVVNPYNYAAIGQQGDHIGMPGPYSGNIGPNLSKPFVATAFPWNVLEKFAKWCREHHVTVLTVWAPTLIHAVEFDAPPVNAQLAAITSRLAALGLPVLGRPEHYQYDRFEFSDTYYHLSQVGRERHTRRVGFAILSSEAPLRDREVVRGH